MRAANAALFLWPFCFQRLFYKRWAVVGLVYFGIEILLLHLTLYGLKTLRDSLLDCTCRYL